MEMTEDRAHVDSRYVTADFFKDHCDACRRANELQRTTIVTNAMNRFDRIEKDLDECEDTVADYKKTINGKFDKIMYSTIGGLFMIACSFGAQAWMQYSTRLDLDAKFKSMSEGRMIHQGIAQEGNHDLSILLRRLNEIEGKVVDYKRAKGGKSEKVRVD